MSGNTTGPAASANRARIFFSAAAALLIGGFLGQLRTPR
jgi:hypothetical protein